MRLKQLLLCLFSFLSVAASAQVYPVQVTVQAISPYPIYLSDFTQGMSDRLRVQLLLTDVHVQSRRVRLKMSLAGGGLNLVNPDVVNGVLPIELNGGMPEYMGNDRLAPYFNPQNLPGMDPVAYTQPLPEGVYTLCFEAFDFITGEVLSRKSCYTMALIQNDPPLLSLPRNNEGVPQQNPQSLLFQWTPRHLNATNVSYEFSLLELVDTFISPQAAMQVMQPYFQTTTYSTSLWLGPADVPLVPGRKYAWRVRAKNLSGLDELGVFKNNGYSEVWAFTYTDANCAAPMGLLATDIAKRSMKVQWTPLTPGNIGEEITYRISYRLRNNGDRWYDRQTTATELSLFDLDSGTEYELRLGRMCAGTGFVYGNNIYATTAGATDSTVTTSCGLPPAEVDISNQAPLAAMNAGENFTAGDFKVTALQVSGAGGTYSGDGYITVPYLANAKIKVKFNNIFINSERKLAQGFVETTYDPTMSGILDLDDIFEGGTSMGTTVTGEVVTDYQTNFPIGGPGNIVVTGPDDNPSITIQNVTNGGGSGLTISPDSLPVSIADSNGDIYTVEPGNGGAPVITKAGEQAPMQMTPAQLNNLASNKGKVLFTRNNNTQYAFDAYKPEYGASVLWQGKYESLGNEYRVAAKATLPGKPDRITAQVTITDNNLIADSVQFVTAKGTRYTSKHLSGNEYEVMMVGSPANDAQELYAVYPLPVNSPADSGKYLSLGKLLVAGYGPKTAKVVVVPVNGGVADTAAIAAKLNATYNGIGIKWIVQQAAPWSDSTWDADHNGKLSVTGSSAWSVYTPEMEALNTAYKTSHTLVSGAAYLFALPQAAEAGVAGDMPRGKRYGYLFTNNLSDAGRVASHEIGHGMFALKHTFDNAYGFAQGALSDNVMSYGSGITLSKLQWDAVHAPGLVIGVFEGDEDGMFADGKFDIKGAGATGKTVSSENLQCDKFLIRGGKIIHFNANETAKIAKVTLDGSILTEIESMSGDKYERSIAVDIETSMYGNKKITKSYSTYKFICWSKVLQDIELLKSTNGVKVDNNVTDLQGGTTSVYTNIPLEWPYTIYFKQNVEDCLPGMQVVSVGSDGIPACKVVTEADCQNAKGGGSDNYLVIKSCDGNLFYQQHQLLVSAADGTKTYGEKLVKNLNYQISQNSKNKFGDDLLALKIDDLDYIDRGYWYNGDRILNAKSVLIELNNKMGYLEASTGYQLYTKFITTNCNFTQADADSFAMDVLDNSNLSKAKGIYNVVMLNTTSSQITVGSAFGTQVAQEAIDAVNIHLRNTQGNYIQNFPMLLINTYKAIPKKKILFSYFIAEANDEGRALMKAISPGYGILYGKSWFLKETVTNAPGNAIEAAYYFVTDTTTKAASEIINSKRELKEQYVSDYSVKVALLAAIQHAKWDMDEKDPQTRIVTSHKPSEIDDDDNCVYTLTKDCDAQGMDAVILAIQFIPLPQKYAFVPVAAAVMYYTAQGELDQAGLYLVAYGMGEALAPLVKQAAVKGYQLMRMGSKRVSDYIIAKEFQNVVKNGITEQGLTTLFEKQLNTKCVEYIIPDDAVKNLWIKINERTVNGVAKNEVLVGTIVKENGVDKIVFKGYTEDAGVVISSHEGLSAADIRTIAGRATTTVTRHPNWVEVLDISNKVEALTEHVLTVETNASGAFIPKSKTISGTTYQMEGFKGCHTENALKEYVQLNGGNYSIKNKSIGTGGVYEGQPVIYLNGKEYVKINGQLVLYEPGKLGGTSSFFPETWSNDKIKQEVEHAIANNHGSVPGKPTELFGFSSDGTVEIHFYHNSDGSIGSYFPKKN